MKITTRFLLILSLFPFITQAWGQHSSPPKPRLTVEKIMQDPDQWIGTLPSTAFWDQDNHFYFDWKKDSSGIRQTYKASPENLQPVRITPAEKNSIIPAYGIYNRQHTRELLTRNGDLFIYDLSSKKLKRITFTTANEKGIAFTDPDTAFYYLSENNLFSYSLRTGDIIQLTDFHKGEKPEKKRGIYRQERALAP